MTDVLLRHLPDGGEIEFIGGEPTLTDGLETAFYLSLFGGNEQDSGLKGDDRLQWWANLSEPDQSRRYRSQTQYLLRSLPAIPANLRRIEDANVADCAWAVSTKVATALSSRCTMPALNTIRIDLHVEIDGTTSVYTFTRRWGEQLT